MTDWIDPKPPLIPAQRSPEPPQFWLSVLVGSVLIHAGLFGAGSWFWQQARPQARPEPIEVEMISPTAIAPKSSSKTAAIAPGKSSQPVPRSAATPAPSPAPPSASQPSPSPPPAASPVPPTPTPTPTPTQTSTPTPTPTRTPTPSPTPTSPAPSPSPTPTSSPSNTSPPTVPGPTGSPTSSPTGSPTPGSSPEGSPGGSPSPGAPIQTGKPLPELRQGTAGVRLLKVPPDCPNAVSTARQDCNERSAIFQPTGAIDVRYTAPPGFKAGDGIVLEVVMVVGPDRFILEIVSATLAPESQIWADRPEFSEARLQELAQKVFLGTDWVVEPAQNVRRDPDKPGQPGVVENVQSTASLTVELRLP